MNCLGFKDPREDSRLHYGGGDVGAAAAAALYVASNIYSWSEAKQMPQRQADANKKVLELQKTHYDAISKEMRDILRAAIGGWEIDVNTILEGVDFEEAFPEVPRAAEYVPVDPCCEQSAAIECNMDKVARADEFYRYVGRMHEQNDLIHMLSFDSGFLVNLDIHAKSVQADMRGQMDTADAIDILTDNAEQAALTGRIGNTRKTTARDMGISRRRLKAGGRAEFREATQWFNSAVSPLSRQGDIREMMTTPAQRIQLALSQAQLIQQSLQNKNNALAQKEPYLMAKLQTKLQNLVTKLQYKASEAMLTNQFVPNYASIVAPKLENNAQLLGGIGTALENVNRTHFYGPPSTTQDGVPAAPQNNRNVGTPDRSAKSGIYDEK